MTGPAMGKHRTADAPGGARKARPELPTAGIFYMENIVNSFNALYKAYRKTRCGKRDNPTAMR